MRIYAFVERYPSAYKPYYDAQFTDMIRRGHDLQVFAVGPADPPSTTLISRGVAASIRYYVPDEMRAVALFAPQIGLGFLRNPQKRFQTARRIARTKGRLRDRVKAVARMASLPLAQPDVCLVHGLGPMSTLDWLPCLYPRTVLALYYHGEKPQGTGVVSEPAVVKALTAADVVFTNTNFSRGRVIARGASPDQVRVVPVGFDLADYPTSNRRAYRPDGMLRLISVGRLSTEKGYPFALEALATMVRSGNRAFHYTIIGDGNQRAALERIVRDNGLANLVTFTGTLSNHDVIARLHQSDVLLLPSIVADGCEETQAAVVQEAFLSGALPVAARLGGVLESFPEEAKSFTVPQRSASAIVDALERIQRMTNAELQHVAEIGRTWVAERYDIRRLNDRLLNEALSRSRSRPSAVLTG